jgi:tetratricopeptide (TPR) repeat protein
MLHGVLNLGVEESLSRFDRLEDIGRELTALSRFDEANEHFEQALALARAERNTVLQVRMLNRIRATYLALGEFAAAVASGRRAASLSGDVWMHALAASTVAAAWKERGEMERSALGYLDVLTRYPTVPVIAVWSALEGASLFCALGETKQGRERMETAVNRFPGEVSPLDAGRRLYVPSALDGEFREAAEILLEHHRQIPRKTLATTVLTMTAGILYRLSGDESLARRTWREIGRRFPSDRFHSVGPAAALYRRGRPEKVPVDTLPYDHLERSELAYWTARLLERRGDLAETQRFMRMAVQLDRSLRWPAFLARESLNRRLDARTGGRRDLGGPRTRRHAMPGPPRHES